MVDIGARGLEDREWEASSIVISITHGASFHVYCDEYDHLLGNGSLTRVPTATNINRDIPVITGE
jgi:hypothetical protein